MDAEAEARLSALEARVAALEAQLGRATGAVADAGASAVVLDLVAKGDLIRAIKVYRQESGAGLREAKRYVEKLAGR